MSKKKRRQKAVSNKHWLSWLIYICALLAVATPLLSPYWPLINYTQIKTFTFQALVEIMFVAWVVLAVADKRYRPRRNALSITLLLFMGAVLASLPFSIDSSLSFWHISNRMTGVVTLLHMAAWFFVLANSLHHRDEWIKLFKISGLICYAILAVDLVVWSGNTQTSAMKKIFGNSFYMISYVMPHVFLGLYLWLREKTHKKYFWLSLSVVASVAIVLTGSRSGILALIISVFIAVLCLTLISDKSRGKRALIVVLSTVLTLAAVGGFFGLRTEAGRNWVAEASYVPGAFHRMAHRDFGGDRLALWNMALKGIAERPIFGWGNLQFLHVSSKYLDIDSSALEVLNESWQDSSHNQYLDHLMHYGVVGFTAYLAMWIGVLVLLIRTYRRAESLNDKRSLLLVGVLFVNYLIYTVFIFDTPQMLMLMFMMFAWLVFMRTGQLQTEDQDILVGNPSVTLFMVLLIPMLMFCWFANGQHYVAQKHWIAGAAAVSGGNWTKAADEFGQAYGNTSNPYIYELRTFAMEPTRNSVDYYFSGGQENEEGIDLYLKTMADATTANVDDHPTNPKALFLAGQTHRYLYKVDDAAWQQSYDYVQRYLEMAPDRFDAHLQMAELNALRGNYEEAHKWFDSAYERHFRLSRQYGGFILYRKACIYARQRNFSALAETISKSAKVFPGHKDARLILIMGEVVQEGDNLSGFEPFLDLAMTHFQHDVEVLTAGARLYHVLGHNDMVSQVLEVPAMVEWGNSEEGRGQYDALKRELGYIEW